MADRSDQPASSRIPNRMRLPVCRGRSRASGDCEEAVFDGLLDGIVPEFEDDAPKWRLKADVPAIALEPGRAQVVMRFRFAEPGVCESSGRSARGGGLQCLLQCDQAAAAAVVVCSLQIASP